MPAGRFRVQSLLGMKRFEFIGTSRWLVLLYPYLECASVTLVTQQSWCSDPTQRATMEEKWVTSAAAGVAPQMLF